MSDFLAALTEQASSTWNHQADVVLQYVTSGNEKFLKQLSPTHRSWQVHWLTRVAEKLSSPTELSAEEKRFIQAGAKLKALAPVVEHWLKPAIKRGESAGENYVQSFLSILGTDPADRVVAARAIIQELGSRLETDEGQPTNAGRFLLQFPVPDFAAALQWAAGRRVVHALQFLLKHDPTRVADLAPHFLVRDTEYGNVLDELIVKALLDADAAKYEEPIAKAFVSHGNLAHQFLAGVRLSQVFPKYLPRVRKTVAENLKGGPGTSLIDEMAAWLVKQYGTDGLPEVVDFFKAHRGNHYISIPVLKSVVEVLGEGARPAALAAAENAEPYLKHAGVEQLIAWGSPDDREAIVRALIQGLEDKSSDQVVKFLRVLATYDLAGLQEHVWKLFDHKSKPVRMSAARTLARLGDPAVERATKLAAAKKSAIRSAAITLLANAEMPTATAALEARVDEETDEEVRDQILLALEQVWDKQGKKLTRAEIDQRIERTAAKLREPVADWLDEKKLPPLHFAGKTPEELTPQQVRYLLYRQSRAKEMRADVEAKPLFALIERKTSGEFGIQVLQSYFASPMEADDRWALSLAALLGDDRCVPALMQQIRKWVDSNRGKLAEYAAQALALLGSDVALCAVDALSIRYRSKQKNIGKAASEAFAEAAERLGVTPDELGDRVVPWLGFEPGQPRLIAQGDKQIEVRIGLDHKLEFRDLVKGKKIGSLPAGIPAEVKNEFKDLGATLREVVKGQLARIENLMVRQFRWPVARWQELYLQHPLLFPFAAQLIWGQYDDQGQLVKAFRALEDRTLTDEHDESLAVPAAGQIGLIHPLELTPDARQAWGTHLADYSVEPPILQLSRPVVFPKDEERAIKISKQYEGTQLNAMTFRSRAERLGWQRGSVTDGGGISSYCKRFPGAGADAILELEGLYIGIGMEESITLGKFSFVKTGTVKFGSYVYDEPANDQDARLIPFGEVPPIVFSETLGDLAKIAGTKTDEE
jgi:hypothetical protein